MRMIRRSSRAALAAAACVLMASLAARSTPAPPPASSDPAPTQAGENATDTISVTFSLDGTTRTIAGLQGGGLASCTDDRWATIASKSPSPDAGVHFTLGASKANVAAWVVDDFAVQFLGEGDVDASTSASGGQIYLATSITGTVWVLP